MDGKRSQHDNSGGPLLERVEKIYYSHGLFCSSHPVPVIFFASLVIVLCCYPLLYLPLPGNAPIEYVTPVKDYVAPLNVTHQSSTNIVNPKWYHGPPLGYILQVVVKTTVSPWVQRLATADAVRGQLKQVFDVVGAIRNFQYQCNNSVITLDNICLHVSESIHHRVNPDILPRYGCLAVSPANVWKQDINSFLEDLDVLKSVSGATPNSPNIIPFLKDIMFGIPWKDTGLSKSHGNNQPRVISYAVTVVLEKYNYEYVKELQSRLKTAYVYSEQNLSTNGNITHIHFRDQYKFIEFIPLFVTYLILFLYIYFSVRKIELVKSKLGMAFSAVVTVIASLCMSVGICTWFGLSFTLKTGDMYLKEIFPYLVVIIGLENILVLTKSVVSTPVHLDVKVRVAQGLSKEGWSITKNLCTEITILTFGFFTFVPSIQEFCLFAMVGLLSDFFLQLVFFATILSIDVRRMELSDLHKQSLQQGVQGPNSEQMNHMYPLFRCPVMTNSNRHSLKKSRSSSRLLTSASTSSLNMQHQPRVVTAQYTNPSSVKVPKRLRVVYFWARCRIFQRAFMVTFVVWLFLMAYKAGIVEHLTQSNAEQPDVSGSLPRTVETTTYSHKLGNKNRTFTVPLPLGPKERPVAWQDIIKRTAVSKLQHKNRELWRQLPNTHWPTLFTLYNLSVQGRYISILPSIFLSIPVDPYEAVRLRHPQEMSSSGEFSFTNLDQVDMSENLDIDESVTVKSSDSDEEAYYPSSPQEVVLMVILTIPSVIFVVYATCVLYRCICSRNYAEWRSSWSQETHQQHRDVYTQLVLEAMPILLEGHPQEVECMTTDGTLVVSSCLSGQMRVWDSSSGECLCTIDRRRGFARQQSKPDHDPADVEDIGSDYESGSPPSRSDFLSEKSRKHLSAPSVLCGGGGLHSPSHAYNGSPEHHDILLYEGDNDHTRPVNSVPASSVPHLVWEDFDDSENHRRRYKDVFKDEPNLSSAIVTDFTKCSVRGNFLKDGSAGYNFSRFDKFYIEHKLLQSENHVSSKSPRTNSMSEQFSADGYTSGSLNIGVELNLRDDSPVLESNNPVWCLDCQDNLIAAGCNDGRIEFWDGITGVLKCVYDDEHGFGVTGVCIVGNRIVASRLHGGLDFLELRTGPAEVTHRPPLPSNMHRRSHARQGSNSSIGRDSMFTWDEELRCMWIQTVRAHQQPITELQVEGGRAVTGSQDHSLKVFRVEDAVCQLTLHGHHGPVTALFIDKLSPMTAASGAQDGAVCVWDLLTGACVCRLQGHDGAVAAVTYTAAYVLSAGVDSTLLVWERFQGHLLNTIQLQHNYCSSMVMLTDNLLLTARQGSLVVWDIRVGEPVRIVRLGHSDQSTFVRQIKHVGNAVVCDYGNQLRVVQFPTIVEKAD